MRLRRRLIKRHYRSNGNIPLPAPIATGNDRGISLDKFQFKAKRLSDEPGNIDFKTVQGSASFGIGETSEGGWRKISLRPNANTDADNAGFQQMID